jgi:hypothetical protein
MRVTRHCPFSFWSGSPPSMDESSNGGAACATSHQGHRMCRPSAPWMRLFGVDSSKRARVQLELLTNTWT